MKLQTDQPEQRCQEQTGNLYQKQSFPYPKTFRNKRLLAPILPTSITLSLFISVSAAKDLSHTSVIYYALLLYHHACRLSPFLTVRRGQPDGEAALGDNKALAACLLVLVGQLAKVGKLIRIGSQSLFEVGVVDAYLDGRACLVEVDFGGLVSLVKSCSHFLSFPRPCNAIGLFSGVFSGS